MKLPNWMPFQVNVAPMQLNRFYNVFKSSGEPTYNSDEKFHHSKFAWYANRSSLADINPKSHYLIAINLLNPLLYVYLHALNVEFFRKIWSLRCRRLLCSDFVTSVIRPCLHMIGLLFLLDLICKSCTKRSEVWVFTRSSFESQFTDICPGDMHYFYFDPTSWRNCTVHRLWERFVSDIGLWCLHIKKKQYWLYWIVFRTAC